MLKEQRQAKIDNDRAAIQNLLLGPKQSTSKIPKQSLRSSLVAEYQQMMQTPDFQSMNMLNKLLKGQKIQSSKFFEHQYIQELKLVNCVFRNQDRLLTITYRYATYQITINVLFVPFESQNHLSNFQDQGGFSKIYKIRSFKKERAFKCFQFKKLKTQNFVSEFLEKFKASLIEYFFLFLGDFYNFGPKLYKDNFDIIVYKTCIEFQMECCKPFNYPLDFERMYEDLKSCLLKMHSLNIIHFDIKPENICFSETHQKYVFIDFGLTKIFEAEFGKMVITNYRGTYNYCSKQMQKHMNTFKQFLIDPYHNDAHSLIKSLQHIKNNFQNATSSKLKKDNSEIREQQLQYPLNIIITLKYLLWISYFDLNPTNLSSFYSAEVESLYRTFHEYRYLQPEFIQSRSNLREQYQQQLFFLMEKMDYNSVGKNIIQKIVNEKIIVQSYEQNKKIFTQPYSQLKKPQQYQFQIQKRKNALIQATYTQKDDLAQIRSNQYHPGYQKAWLQYFQDKSTAGIDEYLLNASKFLSFKTKITHSDKQQISKRVLSVLGYVCLDDQIITQAAIKLLFEYALSGQNEAQCKTAINLISSIFFMQIFEQAELKEHIQRVLRFNCSQHLKIESAFEFLVNFQWITFNLFPKYQTYQVKCHLMESIQKYVCNKKEDEKLHPSVVKYRQLLTTLTNHYFMNAGSYLYEPMISLNLKKPICGQLRQIQNQFLNLSTTIELYLGYLILLNLAKDNREYFQSEIVFRTLFIYYFQRQFQINSNSNQMNIVNYQLKLFIGKTVGVKQLGVYFTKFIEILNQVPQFLHYTNFFYIIEKRKNQSKKWLQKFVTQICSQIQNHQTALPQRIHSLAKVLFGFIASDHHEEQALILCKKAIETKFLERLMERKVNLQYYASSRVNGHISTDVIQELMVIKLSIQTFRIRNRPRILADRYGVFSIQQIDYYLQEVHKISCIRCKYEIISYLNNQKIETLYSQRQYEPLFQYLLCSILQGVKLQNWVYHLEYVVLLLSISEGSKKIWSKYAIHEIIINFLIMLRKQYPFLITLLDYSYTFGVACYRLLEYSISYFKQFILVFLYELRINFTSCSKNSHFQMVNQVRKEFFALFLYLGELQNIEKNQVLSFLMQEHWLYLTAPKIKLLNTKRQKIESVILSLDDPYSIFLLLPLVHQLNTLLSPQKKQKFIKKMALFFNKVTKEIKKVLILDYYMNFIRIYSVKEKRRRRLIYRKCLSLDYYEQIPSNLQRVDLIQKFVSLKLVQKMRKKNRDFGNKLQRFRLQLMCNYSFKEFD